MAFDVAGFVAHASTMDHDAVHELVDDCFDALEQVIDSAHTMRAVYFGIASSLERQLTFMGDRLLPPLIRQVNEGHRGISIEEFQAPHECDGEGDRSIRIATAQEKLDRLNTDLIEAAQLFATAVARHDEISQNLNQLTWSAIKNRVKTPPNASGTASTITCDAAKFLKKVERDKTLNDDIPF